MTAQTIRASVLAVVVFTATIVFAQKINTEFDQSANFAKYKTFAIRGGQFNSKNPALNSELSQKKIETDIRNALTAKGLKEAFGRPDLIVHYHFGAVQKHQVERYATGIRGRGTRVVHEPYTEGTLVIDLRDAAGKSLVWHSVATEDKGNAGDVGKKLDDMVRKSFDKYPPKK